MSSGPPPAPRPDPLDEEASQVFRHRLLEAGFLDPAEVEQAFGRYADRAIEEAQATAPANPNFASFLLQRGLLSLSQLAELSATIPDSGDDLQAEEESESDRLVGQTFSGCVIESLLARGGMGSVYLARRGLQKVVVKFLAPHLACDRQLRQRFMREGEVLERLPPHPNVVGIVAMGVMEDQPHIVMEYVEGLSLERVLEERWCMPFREATRVARDIALGLAAAHDHGIVHRDVKPANVLLTPQGVVKVVDFGLAKDMFASALTRPGTRLGTPYYMAPEQWGDQDMDARCDVFSLGATLYHLLVGEPPFLGRDSKEVGERIISGEYTPPRRVVPELPRDLELVVFQMLQSDRRFRYPRIKLCAEDLERVLCEQPPRVPCLDEVVDGELRRRFPLLPGRVFTLGRELECDVRIVDPSVSRKHARFRREDRGFILRDLNSTFGSFVDDMRVDRPLGLKHGDRVRVGRVNLQFQNPWNQRSSESAEVDPQVKRKVVPIPVLQTLVSLGDPRTILSLIERVEADAFSEKQTHAAILELFGEETADEVRTRRLAIDARARARMPARLHALTGEDRGSDPSEWLAWWDQVRADYALQIGPEQVRRSPRLQVLQGESGGSTDFDLTGGDLFRIGRSEQCDFQLINRSVSRVHATIFRLHQRLVVRDEGSRLGTIVNGQRVRVAFLNPGDSLYLGEVKLRLETREESSRTERVGLNLFAVDPSSYQALLDMKHPSVVTALIGFLHESRSGRWLNRISDELYGDVPDKRKLLITRCERQLANHAEQARELLPSFLGEGLERRRTGRLSAWNQQLAQKRADLPPQVLPVGWLSASRGIFSQS